MTEAEFSEWGRQLMLRRPSLAVWRNKLEPDAWRAVCNDWFDLFRDVELEDANQSLLCLARGEIQLPEFRLEDSGYIIAKWCRDRRYRMQERATAAKAERQRRGQQGDDLSAAVAYGGYQRVLKATGDKAKAQRWVDDYFDRKVKPEGDAEVFHKVPT